MFSKIATTIAATVAVASAQSWTDSAGFCPSYFEDDKKYNSAIDAEKDIFYPRKDEMSLDDESLHELVLEFDDSLDANGKKKTSKNKKTWTPALNLRCIYFQTAGDEEVREKSERICATKKDKETGDKRDTDPEAGWTANEAIPLWNVKRIETNVEESSIVDMTFIMRYTNFSNPNGGYYADEARDAELWTSPEIQQLIADGKIP